MKRCFWLTLWMLCSVVFAQQSATISGTLASATKLSDNVRVGVHAINAEGVWGREVGTTRPQNGRFEVDLGGSVTSLRPFRAAEVLLPGLQNDYTLSAEVNFTRAQIDVYLDKNNNGSFDRNSDEPFLGIAGTTKPTGFFVPIYVDGDTTLKAKGKTLAFKAGWNIFTATFPKDQDPQFKVSNKLKKAHLDIFPANPQ